MAMHLAAAGFSTHRGGTLVRYENKAASTALQDLALGIRKKDMSGINFPLLLPLQHKTTLNCVWRREDRKRLC